MRVELSKVSKRYTTAWILKKLNYTFKSGKIYGIKGRNGSGKSTLMQIISTQLSPTLGKITYGDIHDNPIKHSALFQKISFSAPYISPMDNLNLEESIILHSTFRELKGDIDFKSFKDLLDFPFKSDQLIKYYSSGMKQRVSLAFSLLTKADLILLDEPGSYLDSQGKKWFQNLLDIYKDENTVIISSNDMGDLKQCEEFYQLD